MTAGSAPAGLCAVILAAGEGRRLRPITETVPKALCPVGNVPLLDTALDRLHRHGFTGPAGIAVNTCYLADRVRTHLGDRAHVSREPGPPALGTGGGVANLRDWTAGRGVLVGNADAYLAPSGSALDLAPLLAGWDGETVRVLCVPAAGRPAEFGEFRFAGFSLLPAPVVARLPAGVSELVAEAWRPAERIGRLELIAYDGCYVDTGTTADFLAANQHAAAVSSSAVDGSLIAADARVAAAVTGSVIGAGAQVLGPVTRSVVFAGGAVGPDEELTDAIRVGATVTVRVPRSG